MKKLDVILNKLVNIIKTNGATHYQLLDYTTDVSIIVANHERKYPYEKILWAVRENGTHISVCTNTLCANENYLKEWLSRLEKIYGKNSILCAYTIDLCLQEDSSKLYHLSRLDIKKMLNQEK